MKKIKIDELNVGLKDFFPDVDKTIEIVSVCSDKEESIDLGSSDIGKKQFDQYSGKISETPKNPTISATDSVCEGGSKITDPNTGITSDMVKRDNEDEKTRWSINAYPNSEKKLTPKL